jgi:hypothetical protein
MNFRKIIGFGYMNTSGDPSPLTALAIAPPIESPMHTQAKTLTRS